eukprot:TRINITY_DN29085_c0_g1_i1.p1 TRINITY_DN29085_c0_g1~~TRINITY_DN29085_c0_g1_i1.p1  ORF type:complete len:147 (+),score=8.45 TRINITY_DN29085_c0_g1_i1:36-443(+)
MPATSGSQCPPVLSEPPRSKHKVKSTRSSSSRDMPGCAADRSAVSCPVSQRLGGKKKVYGDDVHLFADTPFDFGDFDIDFDQAGPEGVDDAWFSLCRIPPLHQVLNPPLPCTPKPKRLFVRPIYRGLMLRDRQSP